MLEATRAKTQQRVELAPISTHSAITPPGIGVGSPECDSAIGPVGPVKRMTIIPIRTDDTTPNSTGRIGATVRTETDMANFFAMADDRGLIGDGLRCERTRRDKRKKRRHR